jgi:hypothetical protein
MTRTAAGIGIALLVALHAAGHGSDIGKTQVLLTMVGGKVVWRKGI